MIVPTLLFAFATVGLSAPAVDLDTTSTTSASSLSASLAGIRTIYPKDSGYAAASTPYNLRFAWKPVAISYPNSAQQVSQAIKAGAAAKVNTVARSGGHSYTGIGLGGKYGLTLTLRTDTVAHFMCQEMAAW